MFKLIFLARVKFPLHKPYIVATFTVCLVKCEDNSERILHEDGQQHSIVKLVSWATVVTNENWADGITSLMK